MPSVQAADAIAYGKSHTTNTPGTCENFWWRAFGAHPSIGPHAGDFGTAYKGWLNDGAQHPGDYNVPAGALVYFGPSPTRTDKDKNAGDVCLSLGGNVVIATDFPRGGVVGVTTIQARAKQTQRPYMGWNGVCCGYEIEGLDYGAATRPAGADIPVAIPAGAKSVNPLGIDYCAGFQLIAKFYSPEPYTGAIDAVMPQGSRSWHSFVAYLKQETGYRGNDVLGPDLWAHIAAWARKPHPYGSYSGNNVPGPVLRGWLATAENQNWNALHARAGV